MFRVARALCAALCLSLLGQGCAHFVESQAIAHFTKAMQKEDLAALKAATSTPFEEKALRRSEAIDDLKILRLYPDSKDGKNLKTEIVKVEDVSDHEKLVTVTVGESGMKKLQYRLARDNEKGKWVVDDVIVKQNKKDVTAAKSVTEQMDLLLSVREFLAAWEKGDRGAILATLTPESAKLLTELPTDQLKHLARNVAGNKSSSSKLKPEAHLDGSDAVVKLSRTDGDLVLVYRLRNDHWKVVDARHETKGNKGDVQSVIKTAGVLLAVNQFLNAYQSADKHTLQKCCTGTLFDKSLKAGDLKTFPLSAMPKTFESDQVHVASKTAEFIIREPSEMLKISLDRQNGEADAETPAKYLVSDVTVFDGAEEKRLATVFTSRAVMQLFSEALIRRDLDRVRLLSTTDFNQRVWEKLDTRRMAELRIPEIESVPPQILSTNYHGAVVEITVQQGTRVLAYVLRDWSGHVAVDDVLMPVLDRPNSLKTTLELTLPVQNLVLSLRTARPEAATHMPQIEFLQTVSSKDFNRMVWTQTSRVPQFSQAALAYFEAPLTGIHQSDTEAQITYGDERFGARVMLTKEGSRFVVDDVTLISGPEQGQRAELKPALKAEIASLGLRSPVGPQTYAPIASENSAPTPSADPMSAQPISTEPLSIGNTANPVPIPTYGSGSVVPASGIRRSTVNERR